MYTEHRKLKQSCSQILPHCFIYLFILTQILLSPPLCVFFWFFFFECSANYYPYLVEPFCSLCIWKMDLKKWKKWKINTNIKHVLVNHVQSFIIQKSLLIFIWAVYISKQHIKYSAFLTRILEFKEIKYEFIFELHKCKSKNIFNSDIWNNVLL